MARAARRRVKSLPDIDTDQGGRRGTRLCWFMAGDGFGRPSRPMRTASGAGAMAIHEQDGHSGETRPEEAPGSALSAERGRLKEFARRASALAQKRGRLKNAIGRARGLARRLGRRAD